MADEKDQLPTTAGVWSTLHTETRIQRNSRVKKPRAETPITLNPKSYITLNPKPKPPKQTPL